MTNYASIICGIIGTHKNERIIGNNRHFYPNSIAAHAQRSDLSPVHVQVEDIYPEINVNDWWKSHAVELPAWAATYKLILIDHQQLRSVFSPFCKTHSLLNKTLHWKTIFVHQLCYGTIANKKKIMSFEAE